MTPSVKQPPLDLVSAHDLRVISSSRASGSTLFWESA